MLKIISFVLSPLLLFTAFTAPAVQTGDQSAIRFSGTLRAMTICRVNNDRMITADFKNVGINKLDTEVYSLPLSYTLDCPGINPANTLRMIFMTSRPAVSDPSAIESDVSGLLVKILKDGQPLELNKFFTIADITQQPKLEAQLVKVPGADLTQSPFRATGTLVAEYL